MISNEILTLVGCGLGLLILPIIIINKYLNGLPFKVMSCRGSGGKKVIIRKRLPIGNQYFTGYMDDKDNVWNEKKGFLAKDEKGRVTVPHKAIHNEWGCRLIELDSQGNLYCPDGSLVTGFDAKHLQDLFERESQKPAENNKMEQIKLILAILSFVGILAIGFLTFKNSQKSDLIIAGFNNLQSILINTTVHTV